MAFNLQTTPFILRRPVEKIVKGLNLVFLRLRTDCKGSQKFTTSCQLRQVQRGTHIPAVACDSHLETTGIIAPLTWDKSCLSTNLPRPASLICILTSDHISGGEGNAFYYLVLKAGSFVWYLVWMFITEFQLRRVCFIARSWCHCVQGGSQFLGFKPGELNNAQRVSSVFMVLCLFSNKAELHDLTVTMQLLK